jgi:DNA-binding HxlR family transcriptional regulator
MNPHEHTPALCAKFHRASELIGRRWTGAIIFVLLRARCRFATLRTAIPDITDRMLSERLHELEQAAIVERTVVPATPVRVEYALTDKGRDLAAAFNAISAWAEKWGGDIELGGTSEDSNDRASAKGSGASKAPKARRSAGASAASRSRRAATNRQSITS